MRCQREKIISQLRIHFAAPLQSLCIFIISKSGRNQHLQHPPEPSLGFIPCTRIESWSGFFLCFGDIVFWLDIQFLTVVFSYFYFGLLFLVVCPFLGQAYQHLNPSPERPIPFRTAPPSLTVQTKSSQFFTVQWPSSDTTSKIVISFWVVNVLFLLPHSPSPRVFVNDQDFSANLYRDVMPNHLV